MKILLIHNYYRFQGGEEVYLGALARLLKKNGHKVRLFTKDNRDIESFDLKEQAHAAMGMFWNSQIASELSEVISNFKPDIAHFNNIFPLITPTAYWVCKKKGVPIVQSVHSFRYMFPKSILLRRGELCPYCLNRNLIQPAIFHRCFDEPILYTLALSSSHCLHYFLGSFKLIDKFIFPSTFTKDYYLRNSDIKNGRSRVIPNFVEVTGKKSGKVRRNGFIYVGSLTRQKGIFELLEAVSVRPDINLRVLGDGVEAKEVSRFKRFKNIEILGRRKRREIYRYMEESFFTVIPSLVLEVMPTVLIESFATGTPVIVPKRGVFRELVEDTKTGLFYDPDKPGDLEKTLLFAMKPSLARKMGLAARKEFEGKYTKESYYKGLLNTYQELNEANFK